MSHRPNRRTLLGAATGALGVVLAGCQGGGDGSTADGTEDGTAGDDDRRDEGRNGSGDRPGSTATRTPEGCVVESALGAVDPVPTRVRGAVEGAPDATLDLRWNARVQSSMSDRRYVGYDPPEGKAYVVYRLVIANPTDESVEVRPYDRFRLRSRLCDAAWVEEPPVRALDARFEQNVTVEAGGSVEGVHSFEVPAAIDAAILEAIPPGDDDLALAFDATCDRDLEVGVGLFEE